MLFDCFANKNIDLQITKIQWNQQSMIKQFSCDKLINTVQQGNYMGLEEPLLEDPIVTGNVIKLTDISQETDGINAKLLKQPSPSQKNIKKIKFILTFITIVFTSFQVYDITTQKLQHSRNFIRFLNYYLIEHTYLDIYWAGPTMLNYPIQQYFVIEDFNDFLQRFQNTMKSLDESVYGFMEHDQFLNQKNKILVQTKKGPQIEYDYVISDGFKEPFRIDDLESIKNTILSAEEIQIVLQPFKINNHIWHFMLQVTTFSQSSIIVQIYANEEISLWKEHILTFLLGLVFMSFLVKEYLIKQTQWVDNIPDYLVCFFLLNTFFISFDVYINVKWVVILDGIQCLIAWLLILKYLQKEDDYHISFLIRKSYALVGRLFVSFGPIFIAFTIFGYTLFCRQAWQFSTFKRTFLTLFYISYYNATYESFIVTSRANPISMIFFFSFVILFTICVYSGMLVSIFCSYVWNKRESQVKQDIVNNLKIQCSECNYKYKYVDCVKMMKQSKKTLKMSFIMQVDFSNSNEKYKYKKMVLKKANYLAQRIESLVSESRKEVVKQKSSKLKDYFAKNILGGLKQKLTLMLKVELPRVEQMIENKDCNDLSQDGKQKDQ